MSITKQELQDWLATLPEGAEVAVDEGGLTLVEVGQDAYVEVGGIPDGEETHGDI